MLFKKMLREIKGNLGQFLSLFILSALAVFMFTCFRCSNLGAYQALDAMNEKCNTSDGWIYGEDFKQEDLNKILKLDDVNDAQLRTNITCKSVDYDQAQIELYLEDDNVVNKPYLIEGEEFDPNDTEHVWIGKEFADNWNIKIGDTFKFKYEGITISKKVAGFINSSEYIYMIADGDADTNLSDITYVYMSYKGFPVRKYVKHLIETGKITVDDILEDSTILDSTLDKLKQYGMDKDDITKDMLLDKLDNISDKKLYDMMPYTQIVFTTDNEDVLSMEDEIDDALDGDYAVFIDKSSISGISVFSDELAQHDQFAYIYAAVFLIICLLVIATTMSRMVEKQRTQIGTMNALGLSTRKIRIHYMSYSFVISLLGSIFGFIIGTYMAAPALSEIFKSMYTLPNWGVAFDLPCIIVVGVIVLVCTGSSYFSCRKLLKVHPSVALRPAAPKSGKPCIFEKLPFWDKLSFYTQYDLRDIARAKLRAFMGVFGCACGMLTLVAGIACTSTMDNIADWTFNKLDNYEYSVNFNEDISTKQADIFADDYDGELVMMDSIEIAKEKDVVGNDKKVTTLTVTEGKNLYGLTDVNQDVVTLEKGKVAITSKLAKSMDIDVGDTIYWHIYTENTWYKATIGLINRNPNVCGITMLRSDFVKTDNKFEPSVMYTKKDVSKLEDNKYVLSIHDRSALQEALDTTLEMMWMLIYVCIVCAIILIVVVLYNSGNLSFNERLKEFATLKVMGFESSQIRHLLTLQNLWLSIIGVLLGAPFGQKVLQWAFDSNGDSFDYQCVVTCKDYLISALIVLGVSILVSFMFSKRIKKIDMVEVLKGIE